MKKLNKTYQERLDYELTLIEEKGFIDYFLMVADIVEWAKKRMLIGPARGSAAGSLVCYLLGITTIDPIKHGLLFERFIDVNRHDLPDIDIDFPSSHRESVIAYIQEKYGEEHTAQLVTFSTMGAKSILQSGARILNIPPWKVKNKELRDFPEMKGMEKLEGQISHTSIHAAAIILSGKPIKEIASVDRNGALGMDKDLIEEYGLLKIDILGIETLSIIQDICEEVGFDYQKLYDLPLDDPKIYQEIFEKGKTLGVFQFEGSTVTRVCRDIAPTTFNQLVDITALARPGTMNSGTTEDYIQRTNGASYHIHTALKPYVSDTLGCIIFQEQVMKVVNGVGGFSWAETSKIRKAISKKTGLEKYEDKFIQGAMKSGIEQDGAIRLWNSIVTHGQYSFNLSHAVAYAVLSYWTAFLKTYYPAQFYARTLKGETEDKKIKDILTEWNGDFKALDISKSRTDFSYDGQRLLGGFTNIKGIGEKAAAKIIAGQPFESLEDFESRMPKGICKNIKAVLEDGASWADLRSTREKFATQLEGIALSRPLFNLEDIIKETRGIFNAVCQVESVELKSHNTEEKVKQRGSRIEGFDQYVILKAEDCIIFIDKRITQHSKDEIMDLKGKSILLQVKKKPDMELLFLEKYRLLEEGNG